MQQIDREVVWKISAAYPDVWSDSFEIFHYFFPVMKVEPLLFFLKLSFRDHFNPIFALKVDRNPVFAYFEQPGEFFDIILLNIKFFGKL